MKTVFQAPIFEWSLLETMTCRIGARHDPNGDSCDGLAGSAQGTIPTSADPVCHTCGSAVSFAMPDQDR